jgi:hypothetical protein
VEECPSRTEGSGAARRPGDMKTLQELGKGDNKMFVPSEE